jgi:prepilin-type processing-associated H-X9-DG protein
MVLQTPGGRQPSLNTDPERAGITLVELLVVISILGIVIGLLLGAVQRVRANAARADCQNRMRQLGLSLHHFHGDHHVFPPGLRNRDDLFLYLSWNARLLPYLERNDLWLRTQDEYHRRQWIGLPPMHDVASQPVPAFLCPSGSRSTGIVPEGFRVAFTWYLGVSGQSFDTEDGVLYANSRVRFADIRDGASQTLVIGERPPSPEGWFGWWYAGIGQEGTGSADMNLGVREYRITYRFPACPHGPYSYRLGHLDSECDALHFWSLHPGGANWVFADGSVRFLSYSADSILPALATRASGEVVALPD